MSKTTIQQVFRETQERNPISGHEWTNITDELLYYEVSGGLWGRTKHRTLKGAEKEKALRDAMTKRFNLREKAND